jgi:hypothetical protein
MLTLAITKRYFGFGDANDHTGLDGGSEFPPSVHNRGYCTTREQAMEELKAQWLA